MSNVQNDDGKNLQSCSAVRDMLKGSHYSKYLEIAPLVGGSEMAQFVASRMPKTQENTAECHKLDTETQVFFYEQDFYVLSNFSAFTLQWKGLRFDTAEAAYHWEKFPDVQSVQTAILQASSAHEAYKLAELAKSMRRKDWNNVKVGIMYEILRQKTLQHEYVARKLIATGDRELVEDSWRDDFWGWGPNKDGQNVLGKLWMRVRTELNQGILCHPGEVRRG